MYLHESSQGAYKIGDVTVQRERIRQQTNNYKYNKVILRMHGPRSIVSWNFWLTIQFLAMHPKYSHQTRQLLLNVAVAGCGCSPSSRIEWRRLPEAWPKTDGRSKYCDSIWGPNNNSCQYFTRFKWLGFSPNSCCTLVAAHWSLAVARCPHNWTPPMSNGSATDRFCGLIAISVEVSSLNWGK